MKTKRTLLTRKDNVKQHYHTTVDLKRDVVNNALPDTVTINTTVFRGTDRKGLGFDDNGVAGQVEIVRQNAVANIVDIGSAGFCCRRHVNGHGKQHYQTFY